MRYREIAPFQTPESVQQPVQQNQTTKTVPQQRPRYPVQPDQVRHEIVQRKLAYDIAQSANQVEPTEIDKVKAFARYSQVQKQANANAAKVQGADASNTNAANVRRRR